MKITRNQFLKLIPAAALTLTGCGSKAQPANTESLVFSHHYKLDYAQQFTADCYEGGYTMLTIAESDARFLVVPEDAAEVDSLPADVTVLRQPVENIYLVSTSVMDLLLHLDALDSVAFSGTKAEGWYLPEVKQAMEEGKIAYAGKYSAPDYEQILAAGCRLAIENTMILHTPEVKEQLEHFGIPVLVERSSYESDPLARMEWIKLYAALLDKEDEAEALFNEKMDSVADVLEQQPTGKTVAFFYITSSGAVNVRKSTDYVAKCVAIAGGDYVSFDESAEDNAQSTINIQMESFYNGAVDADVLIYNSIIDGELHTLDELVALDPLMADFKAVKSGNVWCLTKNFYQESLELSDLILDVNRALNDAPDTAFHFLTRMK